MKKKGLGHIEAIISFILFVGFLIFAFYFFSPLSSNKVVDSSLTYAQIEISKNTSIGLERYSIVINEDIPTNVGIPLQSEIINSKVRVENSENEKILAKEENGKVYFSIPKDGFVSIYFSEDYIQEEFDINNYIILDKNNYTISSSDNTKIFSEKRILSLKTIYELDYNTLKNSFNLPNRVDFDFSIIFDDLTNIKATQEIPQGLEVNSQQERIKIIRNESENIEFATLVVRIW